MSDVVDFAERRRGRATARQRSRAPDFELHGWLEEGEVAQLYLTRPGSCSAFDHGQQVDMLVDAAWVWAVRREPDGDSGRRGRPVVWALIDGTGTRTVLATHEFRGTGGHEAWWFVKQWWWLNRRMLRYAWRMARGRG